jgi:S1-C subfamily serine protease
MRRRPALALLLSLGASGAGAASLPELVQAAKPAVVLIGTYAETDSPRFQFRGTGFVVGDGLTVVTAAHVLPDGAQPTPAPAAAAATPRELVAQVWLGQQDGLPQWQQRKLVPGELSRPTDVALLRLSGSPVPTLKLAPRELAREGTDLAVIGFPIGGVLGFSHVTHRGVLSSVTQLVPPQQAARQLSAAAIRQLRDASFPIYQLDVVAYPGNSGGPVLDIASGEVIGVLSMTLSRGREGALSSPTGISYAIPVQQVHLLLNR